jgi:hypothetical protein
MKLKEYRCCEQIIFRYLNVLLHSLSVNSCPQYVSKHFLTETDSGYVKTIYFKAMFVLSGLS